MTNLFWVKWRHMTLQHSHFLLSLSKQHLHSFLQAFSLCSGRVHSDLPGYFNRNLHLEWDSFLSLVSSWTPLLIPPMISLANAPVVLCKTLQSMAMVSYAIWDDLTACLCVYLAGLENENSFNPLICSQHQAGKHSLECKFWASQGALMKQPAAGQCGPSSPPALARRVHAYLTFWGKPSSCQTVPELSLQLENTNGRLFFLLLVPTSGWIIKLRSLKMDTECNSVRWTFRF